MPGILKIGYNRIRNSRHLLSLWRNTLIYYKMSRRLCHGNSIRYRFHGVSIVFPNTWHTLFVRVTPAGASGFIEILISQTIHLLTTTSCLQSKFPKPFRITLLIHKSYVKTANKNHTKCKRKSGTYGPLVFNDALRNVLLFLHNSFTLNPDLLMDFSFFGFRFFLNRKSMAYGTRRFSTAFSRTPQ